MYTVTVLTPKGRRQQVKVTPNTTLLQVLEEVCTKHGFNAQEYDLRHHNKILDVSSMFRFTSLPNNAQLEMTEALRQRQESPVTLGLQFETGERLTGVFRPSETIFNVIVNLVPEEQITENLVVIYMRNEIYGLENLARTTLRSLGLTSGRAMLRVLHKSAEELHIQANVSSVLPPRVSILGKADGKAGKDTSKSPELSKKGNQNEKPKASSPEAASKKNATPEPVRKEAKYTEAAKLKGNVSENIVKDEKSKKGLLESSRSNAEPKRVQSSIKETQEDMKTMPESVSRSNAGIVEACEKPAGEPKIILLGERNAVAYSLNCVKPTEFVEEPDDFFDLTINDAHLLMKQAKQLCAELEDAPLMTAAQREFEKDKKVLSLLNQYKKTILRVKFPDRTVLQGTFFSLETVSAVEKFVSEYLEYPKLQFYLYTTPPKAILRSDSRLIECGCVPSCVVYFGLPQTVEPPSQYLKTEVLEKLSTPSAAALHAYQTRGIDKKAGMNESESIPDELDPEKRTWLTDPNVSEAGPSGNQDWQNTQRDSDRSPPYIKIPKWFRTNK